MISVECTAQEYCATHESLDDIESAIDWSNAYSLHNWIIKFNLYCDKTFEIGLFGSLYFFGFISTTLIFPPLSD